MVNSETIDGGFIVAGSSLSFDGDVIGHHGDSANFINDYWIVKLDIFGNIEWAKALGGSNGNFAYSIEQTYDRGYIVAGRLESNDGDVSGNHGCWDYWIVKLDNAGIIQWQKSLGGSGNDQAYSIQQTIDGGYIVAGSSDSKDGDVTGNHGGGDYWIVKLSPEKGINHQQAISDSLWSIAAPEVELIKINDDYTYPGNLVNLTLELLNYNKLKTQDSSNFKVKLSYNPTLLSITDTRAKVVYNELADTATIIAQWDGKSKF